MLNLSIPSPFYYFLFRHILWIMTRCKSIAVYFWLYFVVFYVLWQWINQLKRNKPQYHLFVKMSKSTTMKEAWYYIKTLGKEWPSLYIYTTAIRTGAILFRGFVNSKKCILISLLQKDFLNIIPPQETLFPGNTPPPLERHGTIKTLGKERSSPYICYCYSQHRCELFLGVWKLKCAF